MLLIASYILDYIYFADVLFAQQLPCLLSTIKVLWQRSTYGGPTPYSHFGGVSALQHPPCSHAYTRDNHPLYHVSMFQTEAQGHSVRGLGSGRT